MRPDGWAITETEILTLCLSVSSPAYICDTTTNNTKSIFVTEQHREREMISGRKQPQIKSIEETEAPQKPKHQQCFPQLWVIFVLGEQIFVMEQQIFGKRIFGRWACQQQREDIWMSGSGKNYLCQSLRRDVNCLSLFSQCGFMWIYSWKTTHSWKTSYLIWLEVQ